jgi:uncharacterized Zn finger protein
VYFGWQPYVPVAERRRQAEQKVAKLRKKGQTITPVTIEGRTIAASFWGKSWCTNLERYSDYANRLPRGRTYVRNGSVVDLQIASGEVTALVAGSELYEITIAIAPVKPDAWKSICRDCAGTVSSLVELLQGRLAKSVMDRVCRQGDGLFPSPRNIKLSCSCPDSASMCKHVAATLYGVGARLDTRPELLFVLRGVDHNDLMSAGPEMALSATAPTAGKVLNDGDVAALFGLEMAETAASAAGPEMAVPVAGKTPAGNRPGRPRRSPVGKAPGSGRAKAVAHDAKIETPAAAAGKPSRPAPANGNSRTAAPGRAPGNRSKKNSPKGASAKTAPKTGPRKSPTRRTAKTGAGGPHVASV